MILFEFDACTQPFDVRLDAFDRLARDRAAPCEPAPSPRSRGGQTFYIETFGCQMNDHDSEKVAGVLLGRGYQQVESIDAAKLVLYNTCSIREKAAQKIFSRLGALPQICAVTEQIIGVLGCVAQQEGEEIFERAPWVQPGVRLGQLQQAARSDRRARSGKPPRHGPR